MPDGNRLVPLGGGVMGARRRMLFNGVAVASLAVDAAGRLRGRAAHQRARAVRARRSRYRSGSPSELADAIDDLPAPTRRDDAALTEAGRSGLASPLGRRLQKRPLVDVHVLRV